MDEESLTGSIKRAKPAGPYLRICAYFSLFLGGSFFLIFSILAVLAIVEPESELVSSSRGGGALLAVWAAYALLLCWVYFRLYWGLAAFVRGATENFFKDRSVLGKIDMLPRYFFYSFLLSLVGVGLESVNALSRSGQRQEPLVNGFWDHVLFRGNPSVSDLLFPHLTGGVSLILAAIFLIILRLLEQRFDALE